LLEARPTLQLAACGVRECWDTETRIGTWCAPGVGGEGACLNNNASSLLSLNDAECDVFNIDKALVESIATIISVVAGATTPGR
jgi:hypothetical protein